MDSDAPVFRTWEEATGQIRQGVLTGWAGLASPGAGRIRVWVRAYPTEGPRADLSALVDPAGPGRGTPALTAALDRLLPRLGTPFVGELEIRAETARHGRPLLWEGQLRVGQARISVAQQRHRERELSRAMKSAMEANKQMIDMFGKAPEVILANAALAREMRVASPEAEEAATKSTWVDGLAAAGEFAGGVFRGWTRAGSESGRRSSTAWRAPAGGGAWEPGPAPLPLESELEEQAWEDLPDVHEDLFDAWEVVEE